MKFSVGEIAIFAEKPDNPFCRIARGDEVEVVRVGPIPAGTFVSDGRLYATPVTVDYEIKGPDGSHWHCWETDLRKRPGEEDTGDLHEWMDRHNLLPNHEGETA